MKKTKICEYCGNKAKNPKYNEFLRIKVCPTCMKINYFPINVFDQVIVTGCYDICTGNQYDPKDICGDTSPFELIIKRVGKNYKIGPFTHKDADMLITKTLKWCLGKTGTVVSILYTSQRTQKYVDYIKSKMTDNNSYLCTVVFANGIIGLFWAVDLQPTKNGNLKGE